MRVRVFHRWNLLKICISGTLFILAWKGGWSANKQTHHATGRDLLNLVQGDLGNIKHGGNQHIKEDHYIDPPAFQSSSDSSNSLNQELSTPLQKSWLLGASTGGFLKVDGVLGDPSTTLIPPIVEPSIFKTKIGEETESSAALHLKEDKILSHEDKSKEAAPHKRRLSDFYKEFVQKRDKELNRVIDESKSMKHINQTIEHFKKYSARVKSDIARNNESNSSDFKHVMEYNKNFKPHQTFQLYKPGFTISNSELCSKSGSGIKLVVMVISAPDHTNQRDAIRGGWGLHGSRPDVVFFFLVGRPSKSEELARLIEENDAHSDLVINNNEDVYENLSLKVVSGLAWFDQHCPLADYLLKVDDDMFVQVNLLIHRLDNQTKSDRFILGHISRNWKPVRNPKSKYLITQKQYDKETYPDFATGPSYVISGVSVRPLLLSALEETYLHLEDVFITGINAQKNNVERVHSEEFKNNANRIPVQFMACTIQHTITIHKISPEEQKDLEELAKNPGCPPKKNFIKKKKQPTKNIEIP